MFLQACGANAQDAVATGVFQTQQISQLQTAAAPVRNSPVPSDTPTITFTPTASMTPTYDPTLQALSFWAGDWHMSAIGRDNIVMRLDQSGSSIKGDFLDPQYGSHYILTGTLDATQQTLMGSVEEVGGTPNPYLYFQLQINPSDPTQFSGSYTYPDDPATHFPWCGARIGYQLPAVCIWP